MTAATMLGVFWAAASSLAAGGSPRVILHADDLGATHSVNAAAIEAIEAGRLTSASIMPSAPWFPEAAAYAKAKPSFDWGAHLTLTSERRACRWGPVAPREKVPSLVDADGFFPLTVREALSRADPREVEIEIRAQIERLETSGVRLTHVDSHQLALYRDPRLAEVLFRVAREKGLAVTQAVSSQDGEGMKNVRRYLRPGEARPNATISIEPDIAPGEWLDYYLRAVRELGPGVTAFVFHPGRDDAEMRAFSADRDSWGAAWRQRDFDVLMSPEFARALRLRGVETTAWGPLSQSALK